MKELIGNHISLSVNHNILRIDKKFKDFIHKDRAFKINQVDDRVYEKIN